MRELRDSVLRAVSLVVTDRRWAAPLSAMALGFGLFLGVAIGPGAAGTLATGSAPILAYAPSGDGGGGEEEGGGEASETGEEEFPAPGSEPVDEEAYEPEFAPEPVLPETAPEGEDEEPSEPREPAPQTEEKPQAEAQQLRGTVVHSNPAAGSYALAIAGGELVSVHAGKLPTPGTKLSVEGEPLANNTFAELESKRSGAAKGASIRGVVTYVDPDPAAPTYTLSGRGTSILVRVPAAPEPVLPALGAYATVEVGIEMPPTTDPGTEAPAGEAVPAELPPACGPDPELRPAPKPTRVAVQRKLEAEPEPATYVDLAGIVTGLCPDTGQLLISADDLRQSGEDLLLTVPKKIATGKLGVGDSVVATATVSEDGSLTLSGLASDERRKGAEDEAAAQGDLKR